MERLHVTSNYAMTRYTFDACFPQVFLEHTSHLIRWQGPAAGLGAGSRSTHCSCKEQPDQLQVLLRVRGDQAELVALRTSSGWLEQDLVCRESGWAGVRTPLSFCLLLPLATLGCLSLCFQISVTAFLFKELLFWYRLASGGAVPYPDVLQFAYMLFWS